VASDLQVRRSPKAPRSPLGARMPGIFR